jgi:hypothetical protein
MEWIFEQQYSSIVGGLSIIVGIAGFILSVVGFTLTLIQFRRLKTSAQAATDAINQLRSKQTSYDVIIESEKAAKIFQSCLDSMDANDAKLTRLHLVEVKSRLIKLDLNLPEQLSSQIIKDFLEQSENYICTLDKDIRGSREFQYFEQLGGAVRTCISAIERISLEAQKEAYNGH